LGEAWHNNHHAFPTSAGHGLRRGELDISALVIRALERAGLAWDVVRVSQARAAADEVSARRGTLRLREALAQALPERPFRVELWDGSALPPTDGDGRPTFTLRSPRAVSHVLRAPGQLGLGRAYVSGELEVDDMNAVLALLDGYAVPSLDVRARARLVVGAALAGALRSVPRIPPLSFARAGSATASSATDAPSRTTTTSRTSSSS
jgi:hypothetical protein